MGAMDVEMGKATRVGENTLGYGLPIFKKSEYPFEVNSLHLKQPQTYLLQGTTPKKHINYHQSIG